jgi:Iron-containing redox enzyme
MTTVATGPSRAGERPPLPGPRGPLSEAVLAALASLRPADRAPMLDAARAEARRDGTDPFGDDLHLALYVCYELHYRGFDGVDDDWEWASGLLAFRGALEQRFLSALRMETGPADDDVEGVLAEVLAEPAGAYGVSHHLRDEGEWWQLREHAVHRSAYHLKEADPHAWLIPRLRGRAKAALVAVEFDEFGGGRGEAMHSRLFADLMEDLGLDPAYGRYLDLVPARMLAIVNMMSLFGLHRSLRAAMAGHFAAAEITTAPAARRMAAALERLGASPRCVRFHTEHIEADAVHEQVLRHDVLGDLLDREPGLARDVVFGVRATELLEGRFGEHLLASWREGRTSLRRALPPPLS